MLLGSHFNRTIIIRFGYVLINANMNSKGIARINPDIIINRWTNMGELGRHPTPKHYWFLDYSTTNLPRRAVTPLHLNAYASATGATAITTIKSREPPMESKP
jgi:hypothetical protein